MHEKFVVSSFLQNNSYLLKSSSISIVISFSDEIDFEVSIILL